MTTLLHDIRYAIRLLGRNRGFTVVALVSLALGIGANTALFTVFHAFHLVPQRFAEPEELVFLWNPSGLGRGPVSARDYLDWREQADSFAEIGLYSKAETVLRGAAGAERIRTVRATSNFLPMLGFAAQLGRLHGAAEDVDASRVVVLTDGIWQRRYERSPDVLGRTVLLDERPHTVIGVLPPEVEFEDLWNRVEAVRPLPLAAAERGSRAYYALARLAPGVRVDQAQSEMDAITTRLAEMYPATNEEERVALEPLLDRFLPQDDFFLELAMMVAVGAVLLITCVNLANMLLAKSTTRSREFALRAALGAGRARLVRQMLTESLLLAFAGGALGLFVAEWIVDGVVGALPGLVLNPNELGVDAGILVYALVVTFAAAVTFGLTPALTAARVSINETLKEGASSSSGRSRIRLRNALVVAQLAISLPLFVCTALAARHVQALTSKATHGFDPERVLTLRVDLPDFRFTDDEQRTAFVGEMIGVLQARPDIEAVGAVTDLTIGSRSGFIAPTRIEGRQPDSGSAAAPHTLFQIATPSYFDVMQIPLLRGRDFTAHDRAGTRRVAIVNQRMADRFWPNGEAVGQRFALDEDGEPVEWITVVGLSANAGSSTKGAPPEPMFYLPYAQRPVAGLTLVARTVGDPLGSARDVRAALHDLDAGVPISAVQTVDALIRHWLRDYRMMASFLGGLAAAALCLACIGLYGVMSYLVAQRTQEIGVRVALGAHRSDILNMVFARCLKLTGLGIAIGAGLALPIGFVVASFLSGVGGADPVTLIGMPLLLLLVAMGAAYWPARRAMAVDPMTALRAE